jgi:c-di-AMP phosphodiesterase-like protein
MNDKTITLALIVLLIVSILAIFCSTRLSQGEGVPKFVKVGKSYRWELRTILVQEIDPSGWIKVSSQEKVAWVKFSKIDVLFEVKK